MYWEYNRSFSFFIRIALTAFKNKLNILLQFAPQLFPWLWNLHLKTFLINLYVVLRFINWVTKFRSMFTFSSHFALFSRPLEISGQLRKWLLGSCNCVFFSRNRFCFHFPNRLGSCFLKFVISYLLLLSNRPQNVMLPKWLFVWKWSSPKSGWWNRATCLFVIKMIFEWLIKISLKRFSATSC